VNGSPVAAATAGADDRESLYEMVNGQRVEKPLMSAYATRIAFLIAFHLEQFANSNRRGRAGMEQLFLLDRAANLQRRPDAAFVSYVRWPEDQPIPHTDPWPVVPEVLAEVISPTNSAELVLDRVAEYFQAGVQLVWYVYPRHRQVYVYESPTQVRILTGADELDGGPGLPGFRLPLSALFGAGSPTP
jgi:Uma2 family endonuclease